MHLTLHLPHGGRRLCTRPTLGLHEDSACGGGGANNSSGGGGVGEGCGEGAQGRSLLSKNSVTSMFSAQTLWAAGFLGQGVRMGVFDTGIKEDHPHVKNIKCAALCWHVLLATSHHANDPKAIPRAPELVQPWPVLRPVVSVPVTITQEPRVLYTKYAIWCATLL